MKNISEQNIISIKKESFITLENLYETTDLLNDNDRKKTYNYYKWIKTKTELVINEKNKKEYDLTKIKRGSVVWVEFGFNIGSEFGGKHPAIILRKSGNSVFVIPLSSQKPEEIKPYHIKIEKVYGFKNMERWVNVLRIKSIDIQRIDFSEKSSIGNVKGNVLDKINDAIKIFHIY